MFSGNNTSYAAEITEFNMDRFLAPVIQQYSDHLKAIGSHEEDAKICALNLCHRSDKIRQPHYLIDACDEELLEQLVSFFRSNNVMPLLLANGGNVLTLAVVKKDIIEAGLTSKHEGEFFYQLNVNLKSLQAKLAEDNTVSPSARR